MTGRRRRRGVALWPVLSLAAVHARDGQRCPRCGAYADTRQHRQNRGMGGSNAAERPSNIIAMCWTCNTGMEQHADQADQARDAGWKISGSADPSSVPYWDAVHQWWVLLDDDGGRRILTE